MKQDFLIDYLSYILFKGLTLFITHLPREMVYFLGRRVGDLLYFCSPKRRAIAYANLKAALGKDLAHPQLCRTIRRFYQSFGQNILEVLTIPIVDLEYVRKYVTIEGLENVQEAFSRGKGVIFAGVHAGSWEMANIIAANMGVKFNLLVNEQTKLKKVADLLNTYRRQKGCKIISRQNQIRELVRVFKNNEAVAMTVDQGGKSGVLVKFFQKEASMPIGAVKLAYKFDAVLLPSFLLRVKGPYLKIIIGSPFKLKKTGDEEKDIYDNLCALLPVFEKYIRQYPQEYFWTYKIWKYTKEKNILILSDGKAGHLRQSEAAAKLLGEALQQKGIFSSIETLQPEFKNGFSKNLLASCTLFSGKYSCSTCLKCLEFSLMKESFSRLLAKGSDFIISCGNAVAGINYILSCQNLAKSIVIMKPGLLSLKRFDLCILPLHDRVAKRKNTVTTEGALNLIGEKYLIEQARGLVRFAGDKIKSDSPCLGLLIGGDTKEFNLTAENFQAILRKIKESCEKLNAQLLITTSRRTSKPIEELVKQEFGRFFHCKLLIIANEGNVPEAVGGILGMSKVVLVSCESISMISEAINSRKRVVVFKQGTLRRKHERFLDYLAQHEYISLVKEQDDLSAAIMQAWQSNSLASPLKDNMAVREAMGKII